MSHALITHILAFLTHREAISQDDKSSGIRSAKPDKAHQLIVNTYRRPPKYPHTAVTRIASKTSQLCLFFSYLAVLRCSCNSNCLKLGTARQGHSDTQVKLIREHSLSPYTFNLTPPRTSREVSATQRSEKRAHLRRPRGPQSHSGAERPSIDLKL